MVSSHLESSWLVIGVLCPDNIQSQIRKGTDLWLYSATLVGNQATNTMTLYPTQSHYPDTELISLCPIRLMSNAKLGSDKYEFYTSLVWLDWKLGYQSPTCEAYPPQYGHRAWCLESSFLGFYIRTTSNGRSCTVHTYGNFIVLPHWETTLPAPWSNIPLKH